MRKIISFLLSFTILLVITSVQNTVSANVGDDTLSTAKVAEPTSLQAGILSNTSDSDYYKVTLPSNGQLTVKMSNAGLSKKVEILNEDGQETLTYFTTNDELLSNATSSVGLAKG